MDRASKSCTHIPTYAIHTLMKLSKWAQTELGKVATPGIPALGRQKSEDHELHSGQLQPQSQRLHKKENKQTGWSLRRPKSQPWSLSMVGISGHQEDIGGKLVKSTDILGTRLASSPGELGMTLNSWACRALRISVTKPARLFVCF